MARVLIVDDEENIRQGFREFLELDGHDVRTAPDVKSASRMMLEQDFEVVVTDIIMPGLRGTDLLYEIRKHSQSTQVILITGEPTVDTAAEAVRAGAFDYLSKPVSGKVLQKVVANAAKLKSLSDVKKQLEEENKKYQENLEFLVEKRTADLNDALFGIISAMSVTVEKRDPYTAGHQTRVANLAKSIAEEMALESKVVEGTYLAGMIHDTGKISVPAEILTKPSKLDVDEFSIMKKHSQVGHDILKNINFSWPIPGIVLQHHERSNGTGYPLGLSGDDILMEARILAVADVVEAMSSHRPYRPALGIDKALDEIVRNREMFYEASVVDACIRLFRDKGYKLAATS